MEYSNGSTTNTLQQGEVSKQGPISEPTQAPLSSAPISTPASGRHYSYWRWTCIIFAVWVSAFIYGLDLTILSVIQAPVVDRFGEVQKLGWLQIGFPLGSMAVIAVWSKSYALMDTKKVYIAGLTHFAAGSALCGAANVIAEPVNIITWMKLMFLQSMNAFIVGRVWAGAGGAGMYLGQLNIMSQNTTTQNRSKYINSGSLVFGVGCILGPLIGGGFADSEASWRWAFYINCVIFAPALLICVVVLESSKPRPDTSVISTLLTFDWLGVVINAGLYTMFVIAFSIGGTIWPWSDGRTIGCIVAFVVLLLLFILQQYFGIWTTPANQVFPTRFLRRKSFILLYTAQCGAQSVYAVAIYYIPLFFQLTRGESAVRAATRLLPFIVINLVTNMTNGVLLPKLHRYMPWYLASAIINTTGAALFFASLKLETSAGAIYGYSALLALGSGLCQQSSYSVITAKASTEDMADALGFINLAQLGSTVIVLTFAALVFQNVAFAKIKGVVRGSGLSDSEVRAAIGGTKSGVFDTLDPATKVRVQEAIVDGIRWTFLLGIIAGMISLLSALLMKREKLFGVEQASAETELAEASAVETKV